MADLPIYNLGLLPPSVMSIDIVGTSIESDRSLSGITSAIDYSGGGMWSVKYKKIPCYKPQQHRYWNQLRNILNGGVRSLIVPLFTDWTAPVVKPGGPVYSDLTHSDGSPHSDLGLYRQSNVVAILAADAPLNAGTVTIAVQVGGILSGGETFAINHPTKGWRCYSITDIDAVAGGVFTVGIRPTMREAALNGTATEFARPRLTARLMAGTSMSWDVTGYWQSTPDIEFIEAF